MRKMNTKVGIIKWIFVSVRIESIWQHLPILLPSLCCKKGKTISLQNHCIVCSDCWNQWIQLLQMTQLKIFSKTHQTGIKFHWNQTKKRLYHLVDKLRKTLLWRVHSQYFHFKVVLGRGLPIGCLSSRPDSAYASEWANPDTLPDEKGGT